MGGAGASSAPGGVGWVAPATAIEFRHDIEGLRGVAVLSVLAVHAFPDLLKGGFVGVDIFFVLSGYLISGIVLRSISMGQFRPGAFYARRLRRLAPALCLVLLACLAAGLVWTFPAQSRQIGWHVAAGASFTSNLALWREAGYFDAASEAKPLLHLWSLAIEEQFYLAWPLAAIWLARRPRLALPAIAVAAMLSFALNLAFVESRPTATFFLLPTRAWELLAGALLAYAAAGSGLPWWTKSERLPHAASVVGAALIAVALWQVDKAAPFPGWWALLPVLGTLLILAAGPRALINRWVLGQPVLRFYGAISYPLYLWHWPLLSFPVLLGLPLSHDLRVLILIASVVLAALTYELVEKPLRAQALGRRSVCALAGALAVTAAAGAAVGASDGLLAAYPERLQDMAAAEFRFDYTAYRIGRCMLRLEQGPESFADDCVDPPLSGRPLLLLWGDSHAASLYPGLMQGGHWRLAQFTAARCPPLPLPPPASARECAHSNAFVLEQIAALAPHTVVLGGYVLLYGRSPAALAEYIAGLRASVAQLRAMGVQRVVVLGHLPTWTVPLPRAWLQQQAAAGPPERLQRHLDPAARVVDESIGAALSGSGAVFFSLHRALCNDDGCLAHVEIDDRLLPLMADESHLTNEGSALVAAALQRALFAR